MQRKTRIALAGGLIVILIAGGIWAGRFRRQQPAAGPQLEPATATELTLTPARADAMGIDPATSFTLTADKPLDAAQVQSRLRVEPALALQVEKADQQGKKFTVRPAQALEPAKIYRFAMAPAVGVSRPYKWSFQTKGVFQVIGTLPRDQAAGVPVNTGIEITFSHANYADIDAFFQISPAVSGRFERHGKTVAFVPHDPLQVGTIYTVTLKQGVTQKDSTGVIAADYVFRFETQAAPGTNPKEQYFQAPGEPQEYGTSDAPYLQVYYDTRQEAPPVDVKLWRYANATAYIAALRQLDAVPFWAQWTRSQVREDTAGLTSIAGFQARPSTYAGTPSPYLVFPEPLPAGYYLAELSAQGGQHQVHFQVTDLSSYTTITTSRTLVWINDLKTQAPVGGASVTLAGTATSARTDATGVAVLPTPAAPAGSDQPASAYLILSADNREAVEGGPVSQGYYYRGAANTDAANLYWKYLYLDRGLYRPDDRVNLWGVLQPREPGAAAADVVTVEAFRWDYYGPNGAPVSLASAVLPVRDGTFSGSLQLPGLKPGYYNLQVKRGDSVFTSRSFEVQTYTKPAYRVEVTPSLKAIFSGQPVSFDVKASFFEGTPVPSLSLLYGLGWGNQGQQHVSTDATGTASISFTPRNADMPDTSYGQTGLSFNLRPDSPEAGDESIGSSVQVFTRNVTTQPQVKVQGDQAAVTGVLHKVTLDQLNAGTGYKIEGDPAPGQTVRGTLIEQNWIKEPAGEAYDFITKTVVKQYNYRPDPKTIGTFTAQSGADGSYTLTLPVDKTKSYEFQMEAQDLNGEWLKRQGWFSGSESQGPNQGWRWYALQSEDQNKNQWGIGEPVNLILSEGQKPVPDRTQGFLFFTARRGLQAYRVQDAARFQFTLQGNDPPNTAVKAVYFDGRQYHEAYEFAVRFDPQQRELTLKVTPDQSSYRPGDTVNLTVQATDKSGQPVQAQVNLNLVDEALYALRDQQANLLQGLYADYVPSGILRSHGSHALPAAGSGAEKGGEGGGVRKDFQDAIYFNTVTTDAAGRATASFRVPDNLTAWRVTYQGIVPGTMQAGSGTIGIPVRLPFFADLVLGQTYLAGDQPVAILRGFGTALAKDQPVDYSLKLTAPDGTEHLSHLSGPAFTPVSAPLPRLKAGTYKVTLSAGATGGLSDALEQSITVVDSYLQQTKVDYNLLTPDLTLTGGAKGLTLLTFTDNQRGTYLRLLQRLQWNWGQRFEQQLARSVAGGLLKQYFSQSPGGEPASLMQYQTPKGSIAILPYSDGDLELTALTADLAPGQFDRPGMAFYLYQQLADDKNSSERQAIALYGLAALGEPVLTDVKARLEATGLSWNEQLNLGLARAALGDVEGTRPLYAGLLAARGEQIGNTYRMKVSESPDEIMVATARTAVLAGRLGAPEAPLFARYLLGNETKDVLVCLEQALLAKAVLPDLAGGTVSFTYTLRGQTTTKELKPGESLRLALTPSELAGLRFQNIKGEVGVTATYDAPLDPATVKTDPGFTVSRTLAPQGKAAGAALAPGDLVKITLSYSLPDSAPGGSYQVVDYLPSGLRLVQRPFQYGAKSESGEWYMWPLEVNGQRVTFWAARKDGKPITYYARVASPGAYTAEQPALVHSNSGTIYALGERAKVTVK